jgi:hypothetical protein
VPKLPIRMPALRRPRSAAHEETSSPDPADRAGRALRRRLIGGAVVVIAVSVGTLVPAIARIERENAPYSGPAAARCVPQRLNVSAVIPGTDLAVSPLPGSYDASPQTQISMLGAPSDEISDVSVTGSLTGQHTGRLAAYSQGDGASFVPRTPFEQGETVEVRGRLRRESGTKDFDYKFAVDYPDPIPYEQPGPKAQLTPGSYQSFHSMPELHPPTVDVTYSSPQTESQADIFAAPYSGPGDTGPMIFEPNGQLVWMDALPEHEYAANLQAQSYHGSEVLTWWQGYIPQNGFGMGEEIVADGSYTPILRVRAGNGYRADLHVFRLEADDTALLTVFNTIHCDLTSVGGPRDSDLIDPEVQELDLKTGLVRREWSGADHVPLSASYALATSASAEWPYDYLHINSVDPSGDGTTLVSTRNTSQLYVIESRSGQVQTTIGGKSPSVKMEPGTETAFQHDANTLEDGDISVFDNGGAPFTTHQQSRALVIELDSQADSDKKVAEFTHPRPLQASSQGNVQHLPDGNWFVGWGGEPYFTEFNASGAMIYDAHLPLEQISSEHGEHTASYRGVKSEWTGSPPWPPAIAAESNGSGLTVYASWNGATQVSSWRVLGGPSPQRLSPVSSAARSGFETAIRVPREADVQVEALDAAGATIGRSRVATG